MAQDSHKDSYEDGMKVRRRVLGDAWVDRSLANRNDFNAEIGRQITSHVWGDIWTRPAIDLKTRRFMTLSIMIALRAWAEFRLHVRSGLATGDLVHMRELRVSGAILSGRSLVRVGNTQLSGLLRRIRRNRSRPVAAC